jgi:hypothetical protein
MFFKFSMLKIDLEISQFEIHINMAWLVSKPSHTSFHGAPML